MDKIPHLKAGLGHPTYQNETQNDEFDETVMRLISLVAVMTQKAAHMALKLSHHDQRDSVSSEDINKALMHQARTFLISLDDPDVVQHVLQMQEGIFVTDDIPTSDLSNSDGESMDYNSDEERCTCEMCAEVEHAAETWDSWEPTDEAEIYLRRSVERAIAAASEEQA